MLKGAVSVVDVVVGKDAVFFAVVFCTDGKDAPGVSLRPAACFVTGAAEVSRDVGEAGDVVRVVRFDACAERGDAAYVVDISATVAGATARPAGPAVPARAREG